MRIDILTLFPEMFEALNHSIIKRAKNSSYLEVNIINIRDFSLDPHKKCDDSPYGGGAGMVMSAQPIVSAFESVNTNDSRCIFASPRGKVFSQNLAKELAKEKHLIFVCGHYEGVDERAISLCKMEEISIGDYVLTGGELPVMVMIDALVRNINGVINENSLQEESFSAGLLEYPQYTRPENFRGQNVPEILLSGHHKNIEKWRKQQSVLITKQNRPDLLTD